MLFTDVVARWHDLYALLGGASANLIGLLFVSVSVGTRFFGKERLPALRIFLSPSVVHFACIFCASLFTMLPDGSGLMAAVTIGSLGLFGLAYQGVIVRSMLRRGMHRVLDAEDRVWYAAVPALAYLLIAVAGIALVGLAHVGCWLLAFALAVLLVAGIRNAWDITVWAATQGPG